MTGNDKDYPTDNEGNGSGYDEVDPVIQGLAFSGVDIYASWALGSGCDDFFPSKEQREWLPLLFELEGISAENFARGFLHPEEPLISQDQLNEEQKFRIWRENVRVAGVHVNPVAPLEDVAPLGNRTYVTALVYVGADDPERPLRRNFFSFLGGEEDQNPKLKEVFLRNMIGSPLDDDALSPFLTPVPGEPDEKREAIGSASSPVVVAVIDDGIAFAHERFRNATDETRIEYTWLQGGYFDTPSRPPDILHGREVNKADLDSQLSSQTSGGIVDEHAVYRHFGVEDFSRIRNHDRSGHKSTAQRASHGAHVMDVAAGYPPTDDRIDRPMICVQLPTEVTADTSGSRLEFHLVEAVDYILRRADSIAVDPLPVVINFSYGNALGPHDGTSIIERFLDQRIRERNALAPLRIVLPAGNSHLSRTHAQISFRPTVDPPDTPVMKRTLAWRVQPNDLTWSFMEIWLPRGRPTSGSRVSLTIEAPEGSVSIPLSETDVPPNTRLPTSASTDDEAFCIVSYKHDADSNRGMFWITIRPTDRMEPSALPLAPAGTWKVQLTNSSFDSDDLIHAWIQRDDTPFGYPIYGRQSYFDDPNYKRYDDGGRTIEQDSVHSYVKRAGTISGIATGDETIVVGGVYRREMCAAEYSSGGPTYDSDRVGPDASAVSDDTPVHRGILAAGTRSGSKVAINGTSVAAPQIARWVADELASGSNTGGDRTAVKNRAIIEETTPPERPPRPSHERGGAGRIIRPPIESVDRFER